MDPLEEQLYAIAGQEVASRNMSPGLMAKALADANGDEKKAAAAYIRLRVEQLRTESKARGAEEQQRQDQLRAATPESDGYVRGSGCAVLIASFVSMGFVVLVVWGAV